MLGHSIFTWGALLTVVGLGLSSWYHSKMGTYRRALATPRTTSKTHAESPLPNLRGLFGVFFREQIEVEKIGFKRGLPTLMFKIKVNEGSEKFLNLGIDRLLPTAMVHRRDDQDK